MRVTSLFLMIFALLSLPLMAAPLCSEKGYYLKAYVEQVSRKGKEIVRDKLIVDLPPDWSIHMGTFDELILPKSIPASSVLTFSIPKIKKIKKTKVQFERTRDGFVSKNFKLESIFNNYVGYAPGKAEAVLSHKGKDICYFSFKLEQGD